MESRRLVERMFAGDADATGELLERLLPRLRAYVRLRAGPMLLARESASDVVQSVCREVLEGLGRFQWGGEAGFRRWLFETAVRKIADRHEYWTAQKRDVAKDVPAPLDAEGRARELLGAYQVIATPSEHACANEAAQEIECAFRVLSERQQEVIVLSRLVGFTHAEIAEQMGLKDAAAARRLLHRGLSALAEAMVYARSRPEDA